MLWPAAFLDPGSGRIGRPSLWLHKASPLMKDPAQQLRRPEAWKPAYRPPPVSFDPVRPPVGRRREDAERWRGEADCQFQRSKVSCCDITVLIAGGCSRMPEKESRANRMDKRWWLELTDFACSPRRQHDCPRWRIAGAGLILRLPQETLYHDCRG